MRQPMGRSRGKGSRGGGGSNNGDKDPGLDFLDKLPTPSEIVEVATFLHACEEQTVLKITHEKIPYFVAPIYLENKKPIGIVDEIFGPINEPCFSVRMKRGIIAASFKPGDKFYIDPAKLLPLSRFLPQLKGQARRGGRGGGHGGFRGRGGGRGGSRGGFQGRGGGGFRGRGGARGGGRGGPRGGRGGSGFRGRGRY